MNNRAEQSFGQHGVSWVDRLGVWLSQRAIRRSLPAGAALSALELGCGYRASQLVALRDRLKTACAVDYNVAPEVARLPGFNVIESPIEKAIEGLGAGSFDVVLLISVLEHLHEPREVLRRIHGLLKPGGIAVVNVPTWRGKWFLEFSAFRLGLSPKVEMDDHKMYYDKRDLWPLLVAAGFKPSALRLRYHKFGLNLFAVARRD